MRRQLKRGKARPKANRSFRYVIFPVWFAIIVLLTSAFGASKTVTGRPTGEPPSQYLKFGRLTTENGLSNDSIWGIAQDSQGFLWFGTFDGLNRYDGNDFKLYRHDPDDPHSLSGNTIRGLLEDHTGVLWISTWTKGLNQFDRSTERFMRYQHDPDDPHSLSNDNNSLFYEDQAGMAWIATGAGGVSILDRGGKPFRHYRAIPGDPNSLSQNAVRSIYEDRAGVLWVGTNSGGLNQFDRETGQFTHYLHDPDDPNSLNHNSVRNPHSVSSRDCGYLPVITINYTLHQHT